MKSIFSTVNNAVQHRAIISFDIDAIVGIDDQALIQEKQALTAAIFSLQGQYKAVLEKAKTVRIAQLQALHDEVVGKAIEASDALSAVVTTNRLIQHTASEADNAVEAARFQLRITKESRPRPPFARTIDVQAWQRKCAEAEKALEEAVKKQSDARINAVGHLNSVEAAKAKFNELAEHERAIRLELARLTGESIGDESQSPPTNNFGL